MRDFLIFFLVLICYFVVESKLVLPLRKHPSIRNQLLKAGKWDEFVKRRLNLQSKLVSTAPLNDYFNDFFTHTILLGTPPQNFTVRPDTSSSDIWVMDGLLCKEEQCKGYPSLTSNFNRSLFDSTHSSTYVVMNTKFNSGACFNGTLSSDILHLADFDPITQQFGLCFDVDNFMGLHPFDGYLGLAWPSLAADGATPVVQNMIASYNFDKPVFSVYLVNNNDGGITNGITTAGAITYGGLDTTNCDSTINYVPLSAKTYWQFTMGGFTYGNFTLAKNQQAIVSTAEAIIIVPDTVLQQIVVQLNVTNFPIIDGAQYLVQCSKNATFPLLNFTIGGMDYLIPGASYIDPLTVLPDTCALRIESSGGFSFGPAWVLGTPFLRTYCVHHDVGNSQLGLSAHIQ